MASCRCAPTSASGMRAMEGSDTEVWWKVASASRWRSGEEGEVKRNTGREIRVCVNHRAQYGVPEGPVRATLIP